MNKILIGLIGFALMVPCAYAADASDATATVSDAAPAVKERVDCTAIGARIKELSELASASEQQAAELAELNATYRGSCNKRNAGRRVSGRLPAPVALTLEQSVTQPTDDVADTPVPDVVEPEPVADDVSVPAPVAPTPEQVAAWIEQGLCADGSAPNKYGCCGDELFKDLGSMNFACCEPDGGECYPPISKN